MNDKIVSVRMPVKLVEDLEIAAKENYFKDLSELLRQAVRTKIFSYINEKNNATQELLIQLEKLLEELKNG